MGACSCIMNFNKRASISFIVYALILFVLMSSAINFMVDANNIFGNNSIKYFNKYKYKRSQAQVLFNATKNIDRFDTVIFGTSRSAIYGSNNESFKKLKIINLSDIIYGYPSRVYKFINNLEDQSTVKNIYIGLDLHTMTAPKSKKEDYRNYIFSLFPDFVYSLSVIHKLLPNSLPLSFMTVKNNWNNKIPGSYMDHFGVRHYNANQHNYSTKVDYAKKKFKYDEEQLKFLTRIEKLCKTKGITLHYFTFPYSADYYDLDYDKTEVDKFISIMLNYVNGIYNFSYINKLTKDKGNYFNRKHHNHNFDKYLYDALILNKKHGEIDGETVFEFIQNEK